MAFHSLTEPASVADWIAPQLSVLLGRSAIVRHCEVLHARRRLYAKPGSAHRSYVDFCYRLGLREPGDGAESTEILSGRGYLQRPSDTAAAILGKPATHPDLHVYVRRFPDDPGLPCLVGLAGAQAVDLLPDAAKQWLHHPAAVQAEVVSYRPGERCVLRFSPAACGIVRPARQPNVFAKCYSLGLGAKVAARCRRLLQSAEGLSLPALLHFDAARDVLWFAGIDGPLAADHCDGPQGAETVRLLAAGAAALHAAQGVTGETCNRAQLIDETGRRLAKLALALPSEQPGLAKLGARLLAIQADLPPPRTQTLHGDLHLRQWVMAAGRAYLVDFDELALGEAEQDLASLIVDMEYRGCGGALVAELLLAYTQHANRPPDPALLEWHYHVQLVAKAYRLYWRGGAAMQPDMLALLDRATKPAEFRP